MDRNRTLTIQYAAPNGDSKSFNVSNANPQATDAQLYQAVTNIMSLSQGTYSATIVKDSYLLTAPTNTTVTSTFNKTFNRTYK